MADYYCHGCAILKRSERFNTMKLNMECVMNVEEWVKNQQPQNEPEKRTLQEIREAAVYVKFNTLKGNSKEEIVINAFMNLFSEDSLLTAKENMFLQAYISITKYKFSIKDMVAPNYYYYL